MAGAPEMEFQPIFLITISTEKQQTGCAYAGSSFSISHLLLYKRASFSTQKSIFCTVKDALLQPVDYQRITLTGKIRSLKAVKTAVSHI